MTAEHDMGVNRCHCIESSAISKVYFSVSGVSVVNSEVLQERQKHSQHIATNFLWLDVDVEVLELDKEGHPLHGLWQHAGRFF